MAGAFGGGRTAGPAGGDLGGTYPNPQVIAAQIAGAQLLFPDTDLVQGFLTRGASRLKIANKFKRVAVNVEIDTTVTLATSMSITGLYLIIARAQWAPAAAGDQIRARFGFGGSFSNTAFYARRWSSGGIADDNAVNGIPIIAPAVTGDRFHTSVALAVNGSINPVVQFFGLYNIFGAADTGFPTPPLLIFGVQREAQGVMPFQLRFERTAPGTLTSFLAQIWYVGPEND